MIIVSKEAKIQLAMKENIVLKNDHCVGKRYYTISDGDVYFGIH